MNTNLLHFEQLLVADLNLTLKFKIVLFEVYQIRPLSQLNC